MSGNESPAGSAASGTQGSTTDVVTVALLDDPLVAAGIRDAVERADADRHAGRHADAARGYETSAAALPQIARPTADGLLRRAADEYDQAGDHHRALQILRRLASEALERDAPHAATVPLREAARLAGPEDTTEIEALFAWGEWTDDVDDVDGAIEALMDGVRSVVGGDRWIWAARLSSVLLVTERWTDLVELGSTLSALDEFEPGPRLMLALNVIDAYERLDDVPAPDNRVCRWAADQTADVHALVRQRAGVRATRHSDVDQAVKHFSAAISLWEQAGGRDEQVVEAFEARGTAQALLGSPSFTPLRLDLTGVRDVVLTHAGRARRLEERALRALSQNDNLIDARREMLLALEHHLAAGNLRGELRVRRLLAKLLEGGGRIGEALWWAVSAGETKRIRHLAAEATWIEVRAATRTDAPPWERTASWAALAQAGMSAPVPDITELEGRLLEDAEPTPDLREGDGLGTTARRALSAVVLQMTTDRATEDGRALAILRDEIHHGQWAAGEAAKALELVTELGISDEAATLLESLLGENASAVRSSAGLIIRVIGERDPLRERVVSAARDGDGEAIEIAAYAGLDDDPLPERYRERVEQLLAEDGPDRTSEQLRSYEPVGIFARFCPSDLKDACIGHLLEVASDASRMPPNRASAVRAIGNATPVLSGPMVARILTTIVPLIEKPVDVGSDDPFARFRVSFGPPEMLAASIVEVAGTLAEHDESAVPVARHAVHEALMTGRPRLYVAAARAARRAGALEDPLPRPAWLGHEDAAVREWGLVLIADRDRDFAADEYVARLVSDSSRRVRLTLALVAGEHPGHGTRTVLKRLVGDVDAEVRARAERALANSAG